MMADTDANDDDEGIFEVLEENENFIKTLQRHESMESFVRSSELVYCRSVAISTVAQHVCLQDSTDIDGCVVELKSLQGVRVPIRRLTIFKKNYLHKTKSILRKHVDLTKYDRCSLSNFNRSVGFQLFFDAGWECWIGVIPKRENVKRAIEIDDKQINGLCSAYFVTVRNLFQKGLWKKREYIMNSLRKNDMNNVECFSVLPDDQTSVLQILQEAIEQAELHEAFERVAFCFRFGEKSRNGVSLSSFNLECIKYVTVHAAMNISSDVMEFMWSMDGLQEIVGDRGVLCNAVSFRDCGNFQSNVDGRGMDITPELRQVCKSGGKLRFIQLYVDTPHRRPGTRFHPVSGCIACGLIFGANTYGAYRRDAKTYVSCLESNCSLMDGSSCRLEVVMEPYDLKEALVATDYIDVEYVLSLLDKRPLLVPFPLGTMKYVRCAGLWICKELKSLLHAFTGTGNIEGIWRAYQLELAAEKLLWGTPLLFRSNLYSINLGPGTLQPSRSLTDQRGFLALEKWSACMANETSIPPCRLWTISETVSRRIERSVGFHDVLRSSTFVLGRRLLHTLIDDFFELGHLLCRKEEFKRDLFSDQPAVLRVHGAITANQLVQLLSSERRMTSGMVFAALRKLALKAKLDISTVIREGLQECRFKSFPAFQSYDKHGNACLTWNSRLGLWKVVGISGESTSCMMKVRNCPQVLTSLVVGELERRGLIHASKLRAAPFVFPWVSVCARKLEQEKLNHEQLICVLCFVSCIALMTNVWFVEYDSLERLLSDLPINQLKLRDYEILSKLQMAKFNKFRLFRLHGSIPWKIENKKETTTTKRAQVANMEVPEEPETANVAMESEEEGVLVDRISAEEADRVDSVQVVNRRPGICAPVSKVKRPWSGVELEILHTAAERRRDSDIEVNVLYNYFKEECVKAGIPFRTREAFRMKLGRIRD